MVVDSVQNIQKAYKLTTDSNASRSKKNLLEIIEKLREAALRSIDDQAQAPV